jgi:hypothetical protein
LKICFEKLEKEKERKFIFIRILVQLSRSPPPRPAQHAARCSSRARIFLLGRAQATARQPVTARACSRPAAAAFFPPEPLTCGSRLSVSLSTFLSSSSGFHRRTPFFTDSVIRFSFENFLLSITGDAYGL